MTNKERERLCALEEILCSVPPPRAAGSEAALRFAGALTIDTGPTTATARTVLYCRSSGCGFESRRPRFNGFCRNRLRRHPDCRQS